MTRIDHLTLHPSVLVSLPVSLLCGDYTSSSNATPRLDVRSAVDKGPLNRTSRIATVQRVVRFSDDRTSQIEPFLQTVGMGDAG
jgi:hypothetical protein